MNMLVAITAQTAAVSVTALATAAAAILLGIVAWFVRREIKQNDDAHEALQQDIKTVESDVKKLLTGDVAWVRVLLEHLGKWGPGRIDKAPPCRAVTPPGARSPVG